MQKNLSGRGAVYLQHTSPLSSSHLSCGRRLLYSSHLHLNVTLILQEITDLSAQAQRVLWEEVAAVMRVIERVFQPDKLNQAAIGNMVSALASGPQYQMQFSLNYCRTATHAVLWAACFNLDKFHSISSSFLRARCINLYLRLRRTRRTKRSKNPH